MKEIVLTNSQGEEIVNSEGKPLVLNEMEYRSAKYCETIIKNALGLEVPITTFTGIIKRVSEQKFYEVSPIDFIPIIEGENPWTTNITSFRDFDVAGDFEDGYLNTSAGNSDVPMVDAGLDPINRRVLTWAKGIKYDVFKMNYAAKFGNWDVVEKLQRSRKRNWDLGIQKVAFCGAKGFNGPGGQVCGLLNQSGAQVNTTRITKALSSMSTAEWSTFVGGVLADYQKGCNYTAMPNRFAIPLSDFLGLGKPLNPDFPLAGSSVINLIREIFKDMTGNKDFQVLPLKYGDHDVRDIETPSNATNYGKQVYALYNSDIDSMRMDVPVGYTSTVQNTTDGFTWQNIGYGSHTGLVLTRPAELMYFVY